MAISQELFAYLANCKNSVLMDVRSEGEFEQGHIPTAINFPLLNNEERAIVGTIFKEKGNQEAVQKGFEFVGGKFSAYIAAAKEAAPEGNIAVYCWRGGMRSNIMAWLFQTAGFQVNLLKGGYKSYRSFALQRFEEGGDYIILGGKTGSGKTEMLQHLQNKGQQVIDLEDLAHHRGSAFGGIGQGEQPSNEQFENNLFWILNNLDKTRSIWLENESRLIGKNKIPDGIYTQMREAKVVEMLVPLEQRVARILMEYGAFPKEILQETTKKLEKKLGNLRMKQAIEALQSDNMQLWARMMLDYYDDFYAYGMKQRKSDSIAYVEIESNNFVLEVEKLLKFKSTN